MAADRPLGSSGPSTFVFVAFLATLQVVLSFLLLSGLSCDSVAFYDGAVFWGSGHSSGVVRGWFGVGSGVVRGWFGGGSGWFGGGSGMVRGWFGGGSGVVRGGFGDGG